jgi:hypothetical protein
MNAADWELASPRITRALRALGLAAAVALAIPGHAQECSGGSAGGTDATGNQCNAPVVAAAPPSALANGTGAAPKPAAAAAPGAAAVPLKAAAHRKKVFDERRARFEDHGHPRVSAAPVGVTVDPSTNP